MHRARHKSVRRCSKCCFAAYPEPKSRSCDFSPALIRRAHHHVIEHDNFRALPAPIPCKQTCNSVTCTDTTPPNTDSLDRKAPIYCAAATFPLGMLRSSHLRSRLWMPRHRHRNRASPINGGHGGNDGTQNASERACRDHVVQLRRCDRARHDLTPLTPPDHNEPRRGHPRSAPSPLCARHGR